MYTKTTKRIRKTAEEGERIFAAILCGKASYKIDESLGCTTYDVV